MPDAGYSLYLRISGLPELQTAGARGHWAKRHREARRWKELVAWRARAEGLPPVPLAGAAVELVRHSCFEPDADNLRASFKPLVDGLVYGRVLLDDSPDIIGAPVCRWEKAPRRRGYVEISVEGVQDRLRGAR